MENATDGLRKLKRRSVRKRLVQSFPNQPQEIEVIDDHKGHKDCNADDDGAEENDFIESNQGKKQMKHNGKAMTLRTKASKC